MDSLSGYLLLTWGLLLVFYPGFFYKIELLTPQQIERNKRIWKRFGIVMIIISIVLLAMS
jgi:hypothetical protein